MIDNKSFLRAILKIFSTIALLWLTYIFTAGFFSTPEATKTGGHTFDLSTLTNDQALYFKTDRRITRWKNLGRIVRKK